jgi:porphobilinogen synthase
VPGVILFGVPEKKDAVGSEAWSERGVIQRAIKELRRALPDLVIMADACFCEYTSHGHCGVLTDGRLDKCVR